MLEPMKPAPPVTKKRMGKGARASLRRGRASS
jgi:hypothetical protein